MIILFPALTKYSATLVKDAHCVSKLVQAFVIIMVWISRNKPRGALKNRSGGGVGTAALFSMEDFKEDVEVVYGY